MDIAHDLRKRLARHHEGMNVSTTYGLRGAIV